MDFKATFEKLKAENKLLRDFLNLCEKYKKFFPLIAFIVGFSWDSLTLSRIDRVIDNLRLFFYLALLCYMIIVTNFIDRGKIVKGRIYQFRNYYQIGIHFFLGGLFSAYVIYYFQSASFSKNIVFVILMVFFLIALEFLTNHLRNISLQLSLLFLVNFAYFTFLIPILTKSMSIYTFVGSGFISILIVGSVIYLFKKYSIFLHKKEIFTTSAIILSIFFTLNILYAYNLIPPVPLSLKKGGVYHAIKKKGDWYYLKYEDAPWYKFWTDEDRPFHFAENDNIIGFTAIFAPNELKQKIFHHWQRWVPAKGKWVLYDKVGFDIEGGRKMGFRGFSRKKYIANGEWRIEVRTADKRLLGRIYFDVIQTKKPTYELKTLKL